MYDLDAGHRLTLRLGAKPTKDEYVETTEIVDALASDPDVLELLRMLCTAAIDRRAAIAQSQPIPAAKATTPSFKGFEPAVDAEQLFALVDKGLSVAAARMIGGHAVITMQAPPTIQTNRQHLARYDQADPLWRLHMGEHDTRVHQHAAGHRPLLFRSNETAERI